MPFPFTYRTNLNPITQGDDGGYRVVFRTPSGPVDITGWTVTITIRRKWDDDDPAVLTVDASIEDGPNGICEFRLPAADTEDLFGVYVYDISVQYTEDGQTYNRTVLYGRIPFTEQVTR